MPISLDGNSRKRGATPLWLVCALLAAGVGWLTAQLRDSTRAAGFTELDPSRVAFELPAGTDGLPDTWPKIVAHRLARLGELSTLEEDTVERVLTEIESMPFVREVGEARVAWPDGLNVEVRMREPVACLCVGEDYLPVSSDGVVLPGYSQAPPDFGRGRLPVIGPVDRTFLSARPGDVLEEVRHWDALSVAVSMREHLSPGDLELLGPVVIDAQEAQNAAVDEPGTRLRLEEGRLVFYGRPPRANAPGELPEAWKWEHVMEAIATLHEAEGEFDWDLVDVRWEKATLRPRLGYR